ncbi:hypothetical protein HX017_10810 [Myroides marinus]|uniref:hypothetical protein n=1 Tax=Myroides marinus TaxID=703342 RepID=UPI000741FFB8|nr:hypothetical protein [Myroides marinus]KUF41959.1 hypothetical protein AS361_13000 [Myroides marinus]MDM1347450.1 hypothetical protein [Myroides marinus]MDM1351041.1 hypothetical protein [Myroides marinus]MDM1355291.1 hypothetical protein [Myroides marinus]MDM1358203.1 hypothetical protein [Myroides marinus]
MKKLGWGLVFSFLLFSYEVSAQCAMCRATLETEDGGVKAEAVNDGIVYLMIFPYLLVGLAMYFSYKVYKNKRNTKS